MLGTTPPDTVRHRPDHDRAQAWLEATSAARIRADVHRLSGPRSRLHTPDAMQHAEDTIVAALNAARWDVRLHDFELADVPGNLDLGRYQAGRWGPTVYAALRGRNIVAAKQGVDAGAVVIGAHYDSTRDSPGADDNASGVAALLELARVIADRTYNRTVLLVAFDMEEIGLHGSREFVRAQLDGRPVADAIIYETIGYTSRAPGSQTIPRGFGALYGRQTRRIRRRGRIGDWAAILYRRSSVDAAANLAACLEVVKGPDAAVLLRDPTDVPVLGGLLRRVVPFASDFGRSDHQPFWARDLPAVLVTDTANFRNPNYHEPSDTPDTLDYEHVRQIVAATALALDRLAF